MREIKHDGKVAKITEANWNKLLSRFNPEGMTDAGRTVDCVLCTRYSDYCVGCPLKVFAGEGEVGCETLIHALIDMDRLHLLRSGIKPHHVHGIENIQKIYNALKALPKVK